MLLDDATWALVREAYVTGDQSISQISHTFVVSFQKIYERRAAENWPLRQPGKSARTKRPTLTASEAAKRLPTTRKAREDLIMRLYKAIDLKLTQMEKHMENSTTPPTSTDHERDTRALNSLVRSFEHVTELNADLTRPAAGKSADLPGDKSHAKRTAADITRSGGTAAGPLASDPAGTERMRPEIAQRLEVILQRQTPPRDAG